MPQGTIEHLISQLETEESKAQAIVIGVMSGVITDSEKVEFAYRHLFKKGGWLDAVGLASTLGDHIRESQIFERVGRFGQAAWAAKNAGDQTRATELYRRGLRQLIRQKDFVNAAPL